MDEARDAFEVIIVGGGVAGNALATVPHASSSRPISNRPYRKPAADESAGGHSVRGTPRRARRQYNSGHRKTEHACPPYESLTGALAPGSELSGPTSGRPTARLSRSCRATGTLELIPDDGETLRTLRRATNRAAKEIGRDVKHGETQDGTLLVWLAWPTRRRGERVQ
jgi:hypothetical protein